MHIGKAKILREGSDVTIVGCGIMVNEAMEAAEMLNKERISAEIIDSHTVKPLDAQTIVKSARKTGHVVSAEEANIIGGLGGAVAEALGEHHPTRMLRVGIRDTYGESGEHPELLAKYGLTSKEILRTAKTLLGRD